jgi:Kdo2-lipid IVA lauroyltransferase/acyltransferase
MTSLRARWTRARMAETRSQARRMLRHAGYVIEAAGAALGFGLFVLLPTDVASDIGGWLGQTIGPLLPLDRIASRNLGAAFPDKSADEIARIRRGMWDTVGRIFAEYPHLDAIAHDAGQPGARVEIAGIEQRETLRNGPGLLFSGHLANWELFAPVCAALGIPYGQIYRNPNNPYVSWLVRRVRRLPVTDMVPKGAEGARRALAILRDGGRLGMLIDQKMNDGVAVPFFGRNAMTAPAMARFTLRFHCPVIPARIERLKGARFRVTMYPPMTVPDTGDREADVLTLTAEATRLIEGWIRERPEQWLWIHRRWPE